MKAKRRIARLLSFLMVFSLIMGTSKMQVFAAGGAGETATFVLRESNGQTGTVQYKLNGSEDFTTANNNTPVDLEGATSITIKVIPTGEAQVNQNNSGITGTGQPATFDYNALTSESGWTYNIQDNDGSITFTIEFDNNDGTGGGSNPGGGENPGENAASYSVDFGTGSWKVGDVTVTADKSGEQTLSESDIITLTGFDAETMEVRVVAEDGFSTTLAVNNNQTSISAKTNDGGVPTDIAFSVVEKSTGGGEVNNGNAVHANVTVNISGEELEYDAPWTNDAADFVFGINGSEMRRLSKEEVNYTTEGDKIVGLATKEALGYEYNYDDSGNVTFNIKTQWDDVITSLTINGVLYDTPQTKDDLINAFDADFRGIRFDIENVPYAEEYHIVVEGRKQTQEEKIMGNFGWTYDPNSNEYSDDDKIPYGNLEFVDAKYNGVTYNSIEEVNEAGGTFQWDDGVKGTDDPTGEAMFPTGTELTLRLIPDAGYQLTSLDLNGTPFEPGEEVGLYTFTIGGGNWHLGAQFTQVGAEVQASSVNIKSGNIDINENFEYGTAKLEVSDVASMDSSRMEEFENTATDEGYEIENYLDISLYNAVYKGGIKDVNGNYESWDTSVENIENKATITLELENDMSGKDLAVIHELHNGEEIIGYELINATYNEENNTITFESDSFSHYAIVSKGIGEGENVYYIDLATGSWTVGDVTVSTPEGTSGVVSMLDTETIPTEMLANFDPETMDITLTTGDGFVIYLEIDENGNTTLASTRDGVELPPYGEILTFAVVTKPGNMEIVDKTEENACNADLAELTDDLISKLLTDAEKTRLENGEEVKVWLEVTDISASVSQTDKDLIDSKKGNATIGMYLDIDLLKQIGSDSPVNITETNGAVTITLKVPSSLINSNSSVTRTYQMIRVHNGVATVIPCTYNAANQTISFETDQFSTYALAYVDQQNNSGGGNTGGGSADGGNKGSGSTGNGSNDNVKDVVPKTGDASIAYVWFMLALVSGIGALYFGKKGLVFKKGN